MISVRKDIKINDTTKIELSRNVNMKVKNESSSIVSGKYMLKLNPDIDTVITIPVVLY